ncbi:glycosyltransferase family 2 protein [Oceanicola sp. D3]|uniref:glycosyltransferase family 2 protein n=1 Tax=Oceanicola sp. D3 TaxID=2587163 RepID=UPI0020C79022|nr:glycosyltransferase family 2 protein [Oceanicola sp. D3]
MVLTTMKNEGPYLLEWIAYHRLIGFNEFTIFSNDCTDGTNLMLNRLDQMGLVRHFDNPLGPRMDPQRAAYSRANKQKEVKTADWVLVIDADEFLNIHCGDRSVDALIEACTPGADAISLNWRFMGSAGLAEWDPEALVTERFDRACSIDEPESGLVWGFKTLCKPDRFDFFGVHRPKFDKRTEVLPGMRCWSNGNGQRMPDDILHKGWRSNKHTVGYELAQINHYAVKSRQEFLLKRLRGTANSKNKDRIDLDYFTRLDLNAHEDKSIVTEGVREIVNEMLADDDLAALHRACLETCRRAIAYQMQDERLAKFVETGEMPEEPEEETREERKARKAREKAEAEAATDLEKKDNPPEAAE